jgi:hypothetical protein
MMISIIKDNWLGEIMEVSQLKVDSRWKHWAKYINDCDMSKDDGYIFSGDWIHSGTVQVETGKHRIILACASHGTNKYHYRYFRVLIQKPDASLEWTALGTDDSDKGWALRLRDAVCALLDKMALRDQGISKPADSVLVAAESFEAALSRLPEDQWLHWYIWLLQNKDDDFLRQLRDQIIERVIVGEWLNAV